MARQKKYNECSVRVSTRIPQSAAKMLPRGYGEVSDFIAQAIQEKIERDGGEVWQFQKYMFNITLNTRAVIKYVSNTGRVKIVAVQQQKNGALTEESDLIFSDQLVFETWMDRVVSDNDAVYNKAAAVQSLLTEMGVIQ